MKLFVKIVVTLALYLFFHSAQPSSSGIAYWRFDSTLTDTFGHNGTWTTHPLWHRSKR
jgi:hypothetical protein